MNSFDFTNELGMLPFHYNAKVIKVTDGDTIIAEVDVGFHTKVTQKFRIYQDDNSIYFDTPETRKYRGVTNEHKEHGLEAKSRATELLLNKSVILHTYKEGSFRWLAEVYYKDGANWKSYVDTMINEGFQKKKDYKD